MLPQVPGDTRYLFSSLVEARKEMELLRRSLRWQKIVLAFNDEKTFVPNNRSVALIGLSANHILKTLCRNARRVEFLNYMSFEDVTLTWNLNTLCRELGYDDREDICRGK